MSIDIHRSQRTRHLVLRQSGTALPGALVETLRKENVAAGWLRASGVLSDVELRTFDPRPGGSGAARSVRGRVQAVSIEGAIGSSGGVPSVSLRAVLAREGDAGPETFCGEIESAHAVAIEVIITALDDVALPRALDEAAGMWLLEPAVEQQQQRLEPPAAERAGSWSSAVAASDPPDAARAAQAAVAKGAAMPARIPARPSRPMIDFDAPAPEAGDVVEHFAFGRCEVIKSDGDRLHLRVKDGRIKEIALEMLRVTPLADPPAAPAGGPAADAADAPTRRYFKLDRRM
jgi:predicted DNA-binding protein with PD1-like motif